MEKKNNTKNKNNNIILKSIFVILIVLSASVVAYNLYSEKYNNSYITFEDKNSYFYKNLDAYSAKKIIDENKNNKDFIILDVRTPQEFSSGRIEGSKNINFYDYNFKEELSKLDKDKTYFIYCRSGSRSGKTLELMKSLGFKKVYNLQNGIIEWNKYNLPLVYS